LLSPLFFEVADNNLILCLLCSMKLILHVVLQTYFALVSLVLLVPPETGLVSKPPLECYSLIIGDTRANVESYIMYG